MLAGRIRPSADPLEQMGDVNQRVEELRKRVLAYLEHGAVILLFDARHPDNNGLPVRMDSHVVRVEIADSEDFVDWSDRRALLITYLDENRPAQAQLAWSAAFYLRGKSGPQRVEAHLVPSQVPVCFEPHRLANVERCLNQMGLGRARPGAAEWNLNVAPHVLAEDADRAGWCADKPAAVQQLLEGPGQRAVVLIDTSHGDVVAPPGFVTHSHEEWQVGAVLPWQAVTLSGPALRWREGQQAGPLEFAVPWKRIGAVQDPLSGRGWFWPADLPAQMANALEQLGDVWPVLQRMTGVPLADKPPTPSENLKITGLSPPRPDSKRRALERLVRLGTTVVLVDTRHPGVELPAQLPGRVWLMMVPLGLPNLDPQVATSAQGFTGQMPDHDGKVVPVHVPWQAVMLMASTGGLSVCVWEQDFPEEIVQALHVLSAAQDRRDVAPSVHTLFDREPTGDGLGLSLECDDEGKFALHVSQPISKVPAPPGSPPGTQVRALLELAFALPPPPTH